MKIDFPCGYDPQTKKLRSIKATFPDDVTQEEFWNFVLLTGASQFGQTITEESDPDEGKVMIGNWNAISSLMNHVEEGGGYAEGNFRPDESDESDESEE